MARDRQRAKRRQAERREARLAERSAPGDGAAPRGRRVPGPDAPADGRSEAELAASAPAEDAGRSDTVVDAPPPATADELDDEPVDEELAAEAEQAEPAGPAGAGPVAGRRERGRVLAFLAAVWAELQRVQWPNRQQLTTLTGVVLGFVLIAGGYLGLLDTIFSRLIQAIL